MADFSVTVKPGFDKVASKLSITAKELNLGMSEAVSLSALYARTLYKKTTNTWNTQPRFGIETIRRKDSFSAEIGTNDLIYKFVEEGTRAHGIDAVNSPTLAFHSNFTAKTKVGWLGSRRGKSSGPMRYPKHVDHPGTQAREFRTPLLRRAKTRLRKESKAAVKSVTERFGN